MDEEELNIFSKVSSEAIETPEESRLQEQLETFNTLEQERLSKEQEEISKSEALVNSMASFEPVELGESSIQTNAPKPTEYGTFDAAFRQYNPTDAVFDYFEDKNFPADESFNPLDEPDFKSHSVQYITELATANSKAQYEWRKSQIEQGKQDNLKLQASGFTGTAAIMAASILDPISIDSGIFTGGATWVAKGGRLARMAKTGALTSVEAAGIESIVVAGNQAKDENDVMYASAGGFVLGSAFGAFSKGINKSVDDMKVKMDEEMVSDIKTGKSTMDDVMEDYEPTIDKKIREQELNQEGLDTATPKEGESIVKEPVSTSEDEIIEEASTRWKANNPEELKGLEKTLLNLDFSDAARLLKHPSNTIKQWTTDLVEHGLGSFKRRKTASALGDLNEKQILSPIVDVRSIHFNNWAKARGITKAEHVANPIRLQEFYREVMEEMQLRRNMFQDGMPESSIKALREKNSSKEIFDATNAFQSSYDKALDLMKANKVHGFENVERIIGYFPLRWNGAKMMKYKDTSVKKLLSQGYRSVGIDPKVADKIASAVFRRAKSNDLGFDTNPNHLFDKNARTFFREMLEDNGVGVDEVDDLFKIIDRNAGEAGKVKFAKRRTDIDLLQKNEEGLSIMDLIDTDLGTMTQRYARESGGRSGLGRYGIRNNADIDKIKAAMLRDASDVGQPLTDGQKSVIDELFNQLIGKPVGKGLNPFVRSVKQVQNLASLHTTGWIAQMAEIANFTALHGITETVRNVKALKSFTRDIQTGKISNEVLAEFEAVTGVRVGDEHLMFREDIYIDDSVAMTNATVDNALGQAGHALGYLNGMNTVKRSQDRAAINAMTNKIAKLSVGKEVTPNDLKRLADIGIDEDTFRRIQKNIKATASFNERGNVIDLKLADWDSDLIETWAVAMNRNTNQMFQRAAIGEDFYWASKDIGSLMTQFLRYPMVAMGKQAGRNIRLADPTSAAVLLYGMAFASAATAAKIHFNSIGRSDREQYMKDRFETKAFASSAINLIGVMSVIPNAVSAIGAVTGMESLNLGNHGRSDLQRSSDIGIDIIPVGSLVNNAVDVTRGIVNTISGEGATKQQKQSAIRSIPFNGIIGIKQLINLTKEGTSVPRNR